MKLRIKIAFIAVFGTSLGVKSQWNAKGNNSTTGSVQAGQFVLTSGDGKSGFYIQKPESSDDPFKITMGSQTIKGGLIIGREDWNSKVMIPWNVGIGTMAPHPQAKLDVHGNIYLQNKANRGSSHFKIFRGNEGKDAATISFGENGKQNWFFGHLYYGGSPSPDLYISKKSAVYNGAGALVHTPEFTLRSNGNVGIGTLTTGSHKLAVEGSIGAREIKVEAAPNWSDFVFYENYNLPTLTEVENHIKEKGHLKDIPSAEEVAKDGFYLGAMDAKLLQKIEELTLYTIGQQKEIEQLKKENIEVLNYREKTVKLEREVEVLKELVKQLLNKK